MGKILKEKKIFFFVRVFSATIVEKVAKFYFSLTADEKSALNNMATQLKDGKMNFSLADNSFFDTIKVS